MKHKVEEITLSAKTPSLETSFSKIALNMYDLVINTGDVDLVVTKTIIIRSRDMKNLLFNFMKRLFDLTNNDFFVLALVKRISIEQVSNEYMLNAVLIGDKMNARYQVKDIVKQITDRNIIVKEDVNGALTQINIVVERREQK